MNASELISTHEKAIEILEGIKSFSCQIKIRVESVNGFPGTFPDLRKRYLNEIDTKKRCIIRLKERYVKLLNTLQP